MRQLAIALLVLLAVMPVLAQEVPPPDAVNLALDDLNAQLGETLTLDDPRLEWSWSQETFPDSSLGCPQPDMMYAQVLTDGYTILFTVDGTLYDYRASKDSQTVVLCSESPAPQATEPVLAMPNDAQVATEEATAAPTIEATVEATVEATEAVSTGGVELTSVEGEFTAPIAWSPSGETIAVGGLPDESDTEGGRVLVLNPADLSAEPRTVQTLQPVTAMAYHQAEPVVFLVVGGIEGAVSILQLEPEGADVLLMQTEEGAGWINSVAINADGTLIAAASGSLTGDEDSDNAVRLWNANTGALVREVLTETAASSVAFSPDGTWLVYGTADGVIHVHPVDERGTLGDETTLEGHTDAVRDLAFSPDNAWLVSGSADGTAHLWHFSEETETDSVTLGAEGDETVSAAAFSPDGAVIATAGSTPNAISLWDAATGDLLATLSAHETRVGDVAFSPDGSRLASVSDGVLIMWNVGG